MPVACNVYLGIHYQSKYSVKELLTGPKRVTAKHRRKKFTQLQLNLTEFYLHDPPSFHAWEQ